MKKFLSKLLSFIILVAVIILMVVASKNFLPKPEEHKVRLTKAKYMDFTKKITVSGIVIPVRETIISAPFSGYIEKMHVKIGQRINAKDPIATIEETIGSEEKTYPIRAPFAGTVVFIQKAEGDFVKSGDDVNYIAKINDLSKFYIDAEIPENDISEIKLDQRAKIKITSILDKNHKGIVRSVALSPKKIHSSMVNYQATYPIRIEIIDKDNRLRSGMSAIVDIIVSKKKNILTLPHEFVGNGKEYHYVILANGNRQFVTTGIQTDSGIEILSGLKNGELVKQIDYFNSMEIN